MSDGADIKVEIIEDEGEGRLTVITAEPGALETLSKATEDKVEAEAQPEGSEPAQKPARTDKGKKGLAPADSADK